MLSYGCLNEANLEKFVFVTAKLFLFISDLFWTNPDDIIIAYV